MIFKISYIIGSIILFLGLFWMFLPHAYHAEIVSLRESEDLSSHLIHTFQGLLVALIGLTLMIGVEKYKKRLYKNRFINHRSQKR